MAQIVCFNPMLHTRQSVYSRVCLSVFYFDFIQVYRVMEPNLLFLLCLGHMQAYTRIALGQHSACVGRSVKFTDFNHESFSTHFLSGAGLARQASG